MMQVPPRGCDGSVLITRSDAGSFIATALARGATENTYVLGSGTRIKLLGAPLDIGWPVAAQGVRFTITKPDRTLVSLAMAARTREKITSEPWGFDSIHADSTPQGFTLNIQVIHGTAADTRLTYTQRVTLYHLL
ncbi:MAG: hypothetical protein JEZ12_27905 [Desulfobacterium sp.]|nr:hypothetical protein [Desulfobacterium sp.]